MHDKQPIYESAADQLVRLEEEINQWPIGDRFIRVTKEPDADGEKEGGSPARDS